MATALVHRPAVLFLDEPTAGLDPEARAGLVSLLQSTDLLHMTTLYTTHHLDEAERLCDTVSIVENGRIIVSESPSTLIREADLGATVLLPNALHQADDIAALAGQSNVRVTRDGVSIRTHDTADLFAALSNHHINTRGVQVHEGRLENVYLQLTGKDHVD